jgi:hypothetical protein
MDQIMTVIKLDSSHKEAVKGLFDTKKYMGVDVNDTSFNRGGDGEKFNEVLYNIFCSNYLSDLNNFHAYGYLEDGQVKALISFYESNEEPSWFYTIYRSSGDNNLLRLVLDEVIKHNEERGRLKFYTLTHATHTKLLRRFHWSKYNNERYGYFDEFLVPAKNKCLYVNPWELLFKRFLVPEDSIVRCNYLKQEYRTTLPIGGNI